MTYFRVWIMSLLLGCITMHAQNKELLYDFTDIPQALLINPGMKTSSSWYAGIPMISGLSVYAGTSGFTVHDIFADDGLDINDKIRDRVIYGSKITDELSGTYQVELLSGGFRPQNRPSDFYSFGVYNEGDAIGYWFKDLAILAYEGNADQLGRRFNLGHLKARGEVLNIFHFGLNRRMSDKLTLGARAKLYSGIFAFNSTSNSGYFLTTEGQRNLLANTIEADMELRTSGLEKFREILVDDNNDRAEELRKLALKRGFLGGDLGLGLDLGLSYNLNERTVFTASLLDLGFMYHSSDIRNFKLKGNATVEGVQVILPDAFSDPDRDFWQSLVDEVQDLVPFEENNDAYISFRPTKLYSSIRYNFGEAVTSMANCDCTYKVSGRNNRDLGFTNGLGLQLYAINRPRGPQTALSAFYTRKLGQVIALKTTYTIDKFSKTNIGLGMNLQAGPVNFYVMADNLLAYRNIADSHYASLQFGLNIISWGKN